MSKTSITGQKAYALRPRYRSAREQITELAMRISRVFETCSHPPIEYRARLIELPKALRTGK